VERVGLGVQNSNALSIGLTVDVSVRPLG
jgi:hypothetical protein